MEFVGIEIDIPIGEKRFYNSCQKIVPQARCRYFLAPDTRHPKPPSLHGDPASSRAEHL